MLGHNLVAAWVAAMVASMVVSMEKLLAGMKVLKTVAY